MPLRKITLQKLQKLVRTDRTLFDAILRNPRKALEARGMSLSTKDLRGLERSLKKVHRISGKRLARIGRGHDIDWRQAGVHWV